MIMSMMKKKMMIMKKTIINSGLDNFSIDSIDFVEKKFILTSYKYKQIESIIEWSKNVDRHFIFDGCFLSDIKKEDLVNREGDIITRYKYIIFYSDKFTSKNKYDLYSIFTSYIRNKKLDKLL